MTLVDKLRARKTISSPRQMWQNKPFRTVTFLASIYALSMATIYFTDSDRVKYETKIHQRVTPSGAQDENGGLLINGMTATYTDPTNMYTLEDFVTNTNEPVNIRFTKTQRASANKVNIELEKDGKLYHKTLFFPDDMNLETKELSYGNAILKTITVYDGSKTYDVVFE